MTLRARADAMLDRVTAEARPAVGDDGARLVRGAVLAALEPRDARFDDHDPRCLAPARTVRILISDTVCSDTDILMAAAFVDSVDGLAPVDQSALTDRARALLAAVPLPRPTAPMSDAADAADESDARAAADDDLLERLVCAEPAAAVIALVERLDQARHLHLRKDLQWAAFHAEVRAAYIPAAHRLAPRLEQRLARWGDAFERRLLLRRPRSCN